MIGAGSIVVAALLAASPGLDGLRAGGPDAQAVATVPMASAASLAARWGIVTSIRRSPEHNRAVGGAPNSYHLSGRAIDIARRAGVRHADIHSAFRKAGYVLLESLDEGDHSHFAFGLPGARPQTGDASVQLAAADVPQITCPKDADLMRGRRRPDRFGDCFENNDPPPKYRPIETAF